MTNKRKEAAPQGRPAETGAVRRVTQAAAHEVVVDCGWGRLLFGQTFDQPERLAEALAGEDRGRRDVALYVQEPHVVLAHAPQALFLDPSHTFRLSLRGRRASAQRSAGFTTRRATLDDEKAINAIYLAHGMVPVADGYLARGAHPRSVKVLVAEAAETGEVLGVVMGVAHAEAFDDPESGSSLWALAVDSRAQYPGIGEALAVSLADLFQASGRRFMDLSVMHDNSQAIALYRKLGFEQVPVYCLKRKNPINEKLFIGPAPEQELNVYARIIVDEARRRGINFEIEDAEAGLFKLSFGGRSIACRESLSDLTSAVAMSRCDDKSLTLRLLSQAGLKVPSQATVATDDDVTGFLARKKRVVVKPARGEQGRGVFVDLRSLESVRRAVERAREICEQVIMEEFVTGTDLRIIVIDGEAVAAAVRRPPCIIGDGEHPVADLIEKQSRRRSAASGGESRIPLDEETERCVRRAGYAMGDVVPEGEKVAVRKTANLHTGGTIHDVTPELHRALGEAAVRAAEVLEIPVVGLDFIVPSVSEPHYHIIEANERPGLANHEPAPTAERFMDFLFPQTKGALQPAAVAS